MSHQFLGDLPIRASVNEESGECATKDMPANSLPRAASRLIYSIPAIRIASDPHSNGMSNLNSHVRLLNTSRNPIGSRANWNKYAIALSRCCPLFWVSNSC